jgi:hypothetical protein
MKILKFYSCMSVACALMSAACSGGQKGTDGPIRHEYNASDPGAEIGDVISEITIVPMETGGGKSLISSEDLVFVNNGEYYFVDQSPRGSRKNVARFDARGRFLNTIGSPGRADNEYPDISSVCPAGDLIEIFSVQANAVFSYSTDGKFIARKAFEAEMVQHIMPADGGGYWAYAGYGTGLPERVFKTDADGAVVERLLPTDANVMHLGEFHNPFVADGDNMLVREVFGRTVWSIDPRGAVSEKYVFDFGRYNIPDSYFDSSNAMAKAMTLMGSDFANFYSLFESRRHSVAQIDFQLGSSPERDIFLATGFRSGNEWRWVKSGTDKSPAILSHSARALVDGNTLVLLADNYMIREFATQNPELIRNPEALDRLDGKDDYAANPSILLCKLK